MFMPYMFYDPTWILLLPAIIVSLWAQTNVNSTFKKYAKVLTRTGYTGAEVARRILDMNGLFDVGVEHINGNLTDNYNPKTNTVYLSDATYSSNSVASIGVAAHECGHAVQHATGYSPIRLRNSIVPVVNVCNIMAIPILILGMFLSYTLIRFGIILFSATVVFQLITLPVEFNASNRAIKTLENNVFLDSIEIEGATKVLRAAALTYVAAAFSSIMSLLHIILIFGGNGRRRD